MNAVLQPALSIADFEAGTIDPGQFDHQAHLYVAWLYLERWPVHEAIGRFCAALRRLTVLLGAPGKYHETISWFFMLLVQQRRVTTAADNWAQFRQSNADLFSASMHTVTRFYSKELLSSELARQHFLLPDRLAADGA